jgi:hypothetical protein
MKPIGSVRPCRLRRVSHLIDQVPNSWDETKIRRCFHPCDVDEILKIRLSARINTDWAAWNFEKSGIFSVRSAYRLAMREKYEMVTAGSSKSVEGERCIWKQVWKADVPSKVRVFAWKVIRNGLPTRVNKKCRHLLCGFPEASFVSTGSIPIGMDKYNKKIMIVTIRDPDLFRVEN